MVVDVGVSVVIGVWVCGYACVDVGVWRRGGVVVGCGCVVVGGAVDVGVGGARGMGG